jgi:hypothetical protein
MHGSGAVGPAHNDVTVNIPAQVPPVLVSLPTVRKPLTSTRLYCTWKSAAQTLIALQTNLPYWFKVRYNFSLHFL